MLAPLCLTGLLLIAAGPAEDAPTNPLEASLPQTDGTLTLEGLSAPVTVARDDLGIPVIRGEAFEDVICAEGFVHGQDRYFQMDMSRRAAAGRVAAVVGAAALSSDRHYRSYRFEAVADAMLERMPEAHRRLLEIYSEGVNAGLASLGAPPPEYTFLQAEPEPWAPRDCLLVGLLMHDALNFNNWIERPLGVMAEALPEELYAFLTPAGTRFEAPLLPDGGEEHYEPAPIPGPEVVNVRAQRSARLPDDLVVDAQVGLGSNSWAVAGSRTAHGGAMIANDPHLPLTAPGIWYRVQLEWGGRRAVGVSLPGVPSIVIGANCRIAWGLTNTMGDFQDYIIVDVDPDDPDRYLTPDGPEPFEHIVEVIDVKGADPVELTLRKTRWGIVSDEDWHGRPLVLKWTALDPDIGNLRIIEMARSRSLEQAVEIARTWYGPSQNVLIADDHGRIAWIVSGYFPKRVGLDGSIPVSWAEENVGWRGPIDESLRPRIIDPEQGILFTANNRTVDEDWAAVLGNTWDLGARASRIKEMLASVDGKLSETDLLEMQLDTRVRVLDFYRDLVLDVTAGTERADAEAAALRVAARRLVEQWDGTADADEAGVRILDAYRQGLHHTVIGPLVAPCRKLDWAFVYNWFRAEEPVLRILEERPEHLLPAKWESWDELLASVLDEELARVAGDEGVDGLAVPWGEFSRVWVRHPASDAAPPMFRRALNMPDQPLPGHQYAVRVNTPSYGVSMRMVVSPGRAESGLMHIPAGESGHPMSPHYRDSHPAWVRGLPSPLLAGEPKSVLTLMPSGTP
jgi:penicillin amidase